MALATPAVRPTATSYQSLPTQALNPVQKVAQETFNTLSFFATLPVRVFDKTSLIMQAYNSGSSIAFKVCYAVSSIFDSNVLEKALQEALLNDPDSPDYFKRVQFLIAERGVNPNLPPTPNGASDNPAFIFLSSDISSEKKLAFLEWLLDRGANPNHNHSAEPLYRAVNKGDLEAVELLLERGADPDLPCRDKRSLIRFAFYPTLSLSHDPAKIIEIIKRLIKNGASPNLPSSPSDPLIDNRAFAFLSLRKITQTQKNAFLEWLLEHGADPNFNNSPEPLSRVLIGEPNIKAARILLNHGANPDLSYLNTYSIKDFAKYCAPEIYAALWKPTSKADYQKTYNAVIWSVSCQLEAEHFKPGSVSEDLRQKIVSLQSAEALLGLNSSWSEKQVWEAYRELVGVVVHPDENDRSLESHLIFRCLNAALKSLIGPLTLK